MVPKTEASVAETKATEAEVCSASMTKGLVSALPYHCSEKPCICAAERPAEKLNRAMMPMGRYRKR